MSGSQAQLPGDIWSPKELTGQEIIQICYVLPSNQEETEFIENMVLIFFYKYSESSVHMFSSPIVLKQETFAAKEKEKEGCWKKKLFCCQDFKISP